MASERRGLRCPLLSGFREELQALLVLAGPAVSLVASAAGWSRRRVGIAGGSCSSLRFGGGGDRAGRAARNLCALGPIALHTGPGRSRHLGAVIFGRGVQRTRQKSGQLVLRI